MTEEHVSRSWFQWIMGAVIASYLALAGGMATGFWVLSQNLNAVHRDVSGLAATMTGVQSDMVRIETQSIARDDLHFTRHHQADH